MKYKIDLHTHTVASSHAYSTLQESIQEAKKKGLEVFGVSDHAPGMPGGAHLFYFDNLKVVPKEIDGLSVRTGAEVNILDYNGSIDLKEWTLKALDYCIASMHPPCIEPSTIENNTQAILHAIKNPYINIIGHPDDSRYPLDYEAVVKTAKEYGTVLEINNSSLNPNGFRQNAKDNVIKILTLCKQYNHPIILGSDAHISYDVGRFDFCTKVLNEVSFPDELVINTWDNAFERLRLIKNNAH